MKKKAIIVSIKAFSLTNKEKLLLSKERPWGIILFKRNIKSLNQIRKLTQSIKKITNDKNFPIIIDEEGSTVSRLSNILSHNTSANYFGTLYSLNKKLCVKVYKEYLNSLCKILRNIGVNINTIPVLDILREKTNKVIGDRSFSENKEIVKKLGQITVEQCHANKIISVIKHIPGHGCATSDSHFKMPKVDLNKNYLNKNDFLPFKNNSAKLE